MKIARNAIALVVVGLLAPAVFAHSEETASDEDMIKALDNIEEKIVSLTEAMPDEVMEWSPGEGVRSTREAIMHMVGANYFFAKTLGQELAEGVDPEKLDDAKLSREETVTAIKDSFAAARNARSLGPAEMAEQVDFFGGEKTTKRFVAMIILSHGSEHLGQLIAYGRTNGVVPPWSR